MQIQCHSINRYIVEMLPFYSSLIGRFQGALLKYDFGHPLKQLCVLKVFHVFKVPEVVEAMKAAEGTLFNPQPSYHGDVSGHSEQQFVIQCIQNITMRPIQHWMQHERCPLPAIRGHGALALSAAAGGVSVSGASPKWNPSPAELLYLKCTRSMHRLHPPELDEDDDEDDDDDDEQRNVRRDPIQSAQREVDGVNGAHEIGQKLVEIVCSIYSIVMGWIWGNALDRTLGERANGGSVRSANSQSVRGVDGGVCRYFGNSADNILFLRFLIGELVDLFQIEEHQQRELMNQTIMYEPSQSVTPSLELNAVRERGAGRTEKRNVWDRPQGEWEWLWALRFHRMFYDVVILNSSERAIRFYLKYISWFHRSYGADIRCIGWYILLFIAWRFCWSWIFGLFCSCFAVQVARSLLAQ